MKLTKKLIADITRFMDLYWETYLGGEIDRWSTFIPDEYKNIGTNQEEIWNSKQDILDYTYAVIDQMADKAELRNKETKVMTYDPYIMVHEFGDMYVRVEDDLTFYGQLRLSSLIQKENHGWVVLHQHGSFPDSKTEVGEAFAVDALKAENKKLLEAVAERTKDLEIKNRELEIEAALERIRAKSMAMHKSEELSDLSLEVVKQVQLLGKATWFCAFNIYDDDPQGSLEWGSNGEGTFPKYRTPRKGVFQKYYKGRKKGESLLINEIGPKECPAHYEYLCSLPGVGDQLLEMKAAGIPFPTQQVDHVAYFNYGYLMFITYDPAPELHEIFQRFAKVFEQSYTRFLDLQKAEEQARDAQIETALEKVRSRSLAMHKSDELNEVVAVLFEKLKELQIPATAVGIATPIEGSKDLNSFVCGENKAGLVITNYRLPYFKNKISSDLYNAIKKRLDYFIGNYSKQEKNSFYKYIVKHTAEFKHLPKDILQMIFESPTYTISMVAVQNAMFTINDFEGKILAENEVDIIKRFARVFEQTYTRFLDLQKAEAQVREAQIEAALERVRAKSMAMHTSENLLDTISEFFTQLKLLDVVPVRCGVAQMLTTPPSWIWTATNATTQGDSVQASGLLTNLGHPVLQSIYDNWVDQKNYFPVLKGKDLRDYYKVLRAELTIPEFTRGEVHYGHYFNFKEGNVFAWTTEPLRSEEVTIFERFSLVLSLTYRRYLDLKKAEDQAREAQIEVALERVRARTMAMHRSSELSETVAVLFEELKKLGDAPERMNIGIINEDESNFNFWATEQGGNQIDDLFTASVKEPTTIAKLYKAWKQKKQSLVIDLSGKELKQWIKYLIDTVKMPLNEELVVDRRVHTAAFFPNGVLLTTTPEPVADKVIALLLRFADVFKLTYTRFLDLLKAEDQAREAQIELSLERIRSQATAMQGSTDLLDIVVTMRNEFVSLNHEAAYFWHMRWLPDVYQKAMTSGDGSKIGMVMELPRHIHGDIKLIDTWEKGKEPSVVYAMNANEAVDYVEKMINLGDFKLVDPNAPSPDDMHKIGGLTFVMARTTHGEIGFSLPGKVPNPPPESINTLVRFASVFDLAYRRFEDLLAAEAQTKEAIKQSSLDRVRAEIASMRTTSDLENITPLLWQELKTLGVPFFRCGVFIVDENEEMVHAYLSTPEGTSLAALHLAFDDPDISLVAATVKHWRLQTSFTEEWTKKEFIESTQAFLKKGQIGDSASFQAGEAPPEQLVLQLVPFRQGMLYAGSASPMIEEHIELVKDLADAFAVAYARYEDFVQLEDAKKKVENTLTDLKSAQNQLVHSEKMASLGELTAGIAHEIQNPLNFVNNFSEVNKELMEELQEELTKGDLEEVKAIAQDIIDNENKIVHHGKRAEGIVKGMLQHSRTSSGDKELTDINVLADEYLRLSYHGLRAKDKSFNADFNLDLDEKLPKVNVVPQDIGRVLLNLINNAFHACTEFSRSAETELSRSTGEGYKPLVTVSTKVIAQENQVEISVSDNGSGIPDEIKDKIFQPFFTTKATGEGTGLGLSLSYDIITKGHEGELKLESQETKGTTFSIILPNRVKS